MLRVIKLERCGPAAGPAVVTAADVVAGHVTLDISCLDRVYLNGYAARLATSGGIIYFFHEHRGKPIVSPAHRPYSMTQASYDLTRLACNGLIHRVPGRNRYTLTRDGLLFAHLYTKVYDHILRPLMAPAGPAHPPSSPRPWTLSTSSSLATSPAPASPPQPDIRLRSITHNQAATQPAIEHPMPSPAVTLRTDVKDVAPKVPWGELTRQQTRCHIRMS